MYVSSGVSYARRLPPERPVGRCNSRRMPATADRRLCRARILALLLAIALLLALVLVLVLAVEDREQHQQQQQADTHMTASCWSSSQLVMRETCR